MSWSIEISNIALEMCWKRLFDPCLQSFGLEDRGYTNDNNIENNGFIYTVWTTAY